MSLTIANQFVDRQEICDSFYNMLSPGSEKQIMLVKAGGGMGKSWLVGKFKHECSIQSPRVFYTHLDFNDGQAHDYLSIVRRTRDDLGAAHFDGLTQTINAVTGIHVNLQVAGTASGEVATQLGDTTGSEVNVAGGNVIKDNFFQIQVDNESLRRDIEARITAMFLADLRAFVEQQPAVFFFDTYEKAPETTRRWIEGNLLYQIREGKLPGVVAVTTGREIPEVDSIWRHCTTRPKLENLLRNDVAKYLREKRGLTDIDIETVYRTSKGNPQLLGVLADNAEDDDDW